MPRGRPKKSTTSTINTNNSTELNQSDTMDFSTLGGLKGGFTNNPYYMNTILKQLLGYAQEFTREQVLGYIKNPVQNELALKKVHQYLMNFSMFYKRIINYLATILTFDYVLIPMNIISNEEAKSAAFKRSYKKTLDWLEKFKLKEELINIMKAVIGEDAAYYYLRENNETITLQRIPTDYCKIISRTELGFQYAFDLTYFNNPGVNIDNFAPEFKEAYAEYLRGKNVSLNWVILDPEKAWCFKFDENTAVVTPPLSGLFIDALEITEFKALIKTRTVLDAIMLLCMKIPMKSDKDAKKNEFLIDLNTATKFHKLVKSNLPADGFNLVTSPMSIESIKLEGGESRKDIIGFAESSFYKSAGIPSLLFESDKKVGSVGLDYSSKTDESFVIHMYRQFERFLNFNINKVSGKYKFHVWMPDITIFNRKEKAELFLKQAQSGYSKTLVACAMGMTPQDFINLNLLENSLEFLDNMKVLPSSHTQNSSEGGRPLKPDNELETKGEESRMMK